MSDSEEKQKSNSDSRKILLKQIDPCTGKLVARISLTCACCESLHRKECFELSQSETKGKRSL